LLLFFFIYTTLRASTSTLFPYTTLFRSHDAGFVSGATVVDNARTFRHKLFRWPDHLERFRRDCATCYVPLEVTDERLTAIADERSEEHTSELQSRSDLVCRLLLEKKKKT